MVEDCKWDVQVNKTKPKVRFPGLSNFTNSEYERLLSCDLINLKSCPIETQRFFALTDWVKKLPWLVWSGNSMKAYFDGIIVQAYAYKEKIGFVKTSLKTFFTSLEVKNNRSWLIEMYANQFKLNCLNGTNFEIGIDWTPKPDELTYVDSNSWRLSYMTSINKVNFTFYNNASEFDMSENFDPSLNWGLDGTMSLWHFKSPDDIYTGFVKLLFLYMLPTYIIYI